MVSVSARTPWRQAKTRPETSASPKRGWTVRISPDVDLASIPPNIFKMAAVLERFYRTSPDCFPSNRTLAARYGCTPRQAQAIVAEMERRGFLVRDFEAGGRTRIRALRRLDLDLPVADADREENDAPPTKFPAPPPRSFLRQKDDSGNEDESNNNPGVVVGESPREPAERPPAVAAVDSTPGAAEGGTGALEPLAARAVKRFGDASPEKVAAAVADHGRHLVEVAVFGLPRLESWRGVLGALANWRRGPDGPTDAEVKAARRSMAASAPVEYFRYRPPTAEEQAESRAGAAWLREFLRQQAAPPLPRG